MLDRAVSAIEKQYKDYVLSPDQGPSLAEIEKWSSRIHLTPMEEKIFDAVERCVSEEGLNLILRVAGGWVRDKLLGIDSYDMDISIDNMMGEEFASILSGWLRQKGHTVSSIGVVAARPAQSKHLETATLTLFEQKIDFVNLRSEMYAQNSRIPTHVAFGTPSDDAHRRDITINALFYNIHTRLVEDWTGRGLRDLEAGIIRTPLPPAAIFMDDPLRVLRALRFASRFRYAVDEPIKTAICSGSSIRDALQFKISRERVGVELKKMLTGPNPFLSLSLIHGYQIWPCVFWGSFSYPPGSLPPRYPSRKSLELDFVSKGWSFVTSLSMLLDLQPFPPRAAQHSDHPGSDEHHSREIGIARLHKPYAPLFNYLIYISAALLPIRGISVFKLGLDRGATIRLSEFICRFFIKTTSIEEGHICSSVENADFFVMLLDRYSSNVLAIPFSALSSCMRLVGPRWEISWLLAQLVYFHRESEHILLLESVVLLFEELRQLVFSYGLDKLWTTKPLLNGNEVIAHFGYPKGNPQVQRLLCELVVWQLEQVHLHKAFPETLTKDLAREALTEMLAKNTLERFSSPIYPLKEF